jgi:hypothetical protein
MPDRFAPNDLDALANAEEIEIEIARHDGARPHRTIIWVVVDDERRVLIRSYRGGSARWFREALANPSVTIHLDGRSIPAGVVVANDDARIQAASEGFRTKYADDSSMPAMLAEGVLSTTLELVPRRVAGRAQG